VHRSGAFVDEDVFSAHGLRGFSHRSVVKDAMRAARDVAQGR